MKFTDNSLDKQLKSLEVNPKRFYESGWSYDLLKLLFKETNYDCLKPLLQSKNLYVRRSVIWIVSELAGAAKDLADFVVPLLSDDDRLIVYQAYEATMSMSQAGAANFRYIPDALTHHDPVIRELGMFLLSNASNTKLREAELYFLSIKNVEHASGMNLLLNENEKLDALFDAALLDKKLLSVRYVLIAMRRASHTMSQDIINQLEDNPDKSLIGFAKSYLLPQGNSAN